MASINGTQIHSIPAIEGPNGGAKPTFTANEIRCESRLSSYYHSIDDVIRNERSRLGRALTFEEIVDIMKESNRFRDEVVFEFARKSADEMTGGKKHKIEKKDFEDQVGSESEQVMPEAPILSQ
ncbi:MAG: hypothetical protein LQ352_006245 [Teloschistes flavicans]|nr:MAG: hypothetical protein LQ352_006245 [Teloschistes flavicans]